jgi:Dolichyl-phosphate-mannose-protein mannosyltransferase
MKQIFGIFLKTPFLKKCLWALCFSLVLGSIVGRLRDQELRLDWNPNLFNLYLDGRQVASLPAYGRRPKRISVTVFPFSEAFSREKPLVNNQSSDEVDPTDHRMIWSPKFEFSKESGSVSFTCRNCFDFLVQVVDSDVFNPVTHKINLCFWNATVLSQSETSTHQKWVDSEWHGISPSARTFLGYIFFLISQIMTTALWFVLSIPLVYLLFQKLPLPTIVKREWSKLIYLKYLFSKKVSLFVLAETCCFCAYFVNVRILHQLPRYPDEICYLIYSKILAAGKLVAPLPLSPDHFKTVFMVMNSGGWSTNYPVGWPAVLALGQWLGSPTFALGLVSVLLVTGSFLLGQALYGSSTGVVAAFLVGSSPLVILNSGSFMSHTFTATTIVWGIYSWILGIRKNQKRYTLLSGVCFSFLFQTRPSNFLPTVAGLMIWALIFRGRNYRKRGEFKSHALIKWVYFALGSLPLVLVGMLFLYLQTGKGTFPNPWVKTNMTALVNRETLTIPFLVFYLHLASFVRIGSVLPVGIFLVGIVLAYLNKVDREKNSLLGLPALLTLGFYSLFTSTTVIAFGPRYWLEAFVLLTIVSAHGYCAFAEFLELKLGKSDKARLALMLVLISFSAQRLHYFFLHRATKEEVVGFAPRSLSELRSLSGITEDLKRKVNMLPKHSAVFIHAPSDLVPEMIYNNPVNLSLSEPLFLLDLGADKNKRARPLTDGRKLFRYDYASKTLSPYP